MDIRKIVTIREQVCMEGTETLAEPVEKIAVMAVIRDPHPNEYVDDLREYIDEGRTLGLLLTKIAADEFGRERIESFGKGAIVGSDCEFEHGAAMNHVKFGNAMREALGFPCKTIIPSTIVRGGPDTPLTVPLVHREANLVRSHFDAMTVRVTDAPAAGEIVVVAAFSCGGRPLARLGGLKKEDIIGDGLR